MNFRCHNRRPTSKKKLTEPQKKHQKVVSSVKNDALFLINKFSNETDFFGKLIITTLIFEGLFVSLASFSNFELKNIVSLISFHLETNKKTSESFITEV
jgi:hypothetical protein